MLNLTVKAPATVQKLLEFCDSCQELGNNFTKQLVTKEENGSTYHKHMDPSVQLYKFHCSILECLKPQDISLTYSKEWIINFEIENYTHVFSWEWNNNNNNKAFKLG
jgi:hypothetical protein